jgi:glutamyl-Q tRNA(Asp) synthetase
MLPMRTRFAPSPTGPLHLGHAFSAILAYRRAQEFGGTFLLRIEDIDQSRARPEWESLIFEDLHWLGITWPEPVMRQSDRMAAYSAALDQLWAEGLLYPCTCKRRDIMAAVSAPQEGAPLSGPDGVIYPGTCRTAHPRTGPRPTDVPLRLDIAHAMAMNDGVGFTETGAGPYGETGHVETTRARMIAEVGDVVLARRDMGTSYHLSVVVDDADQQITEVVRGLDLFAATPIHVLLQNLLGLRTPEYHHHRLIRDDQGRRLAKRDDARALRLYRAEGMSPHDVMAMIGLTSAL